MKATIFGLGALGSNLLVQLAKQFPDWDFIGVDFDRVEERNVRTQAYFLEHVGMNKCDIMRVILSRYLRKPKYQVVNKKIVATDLINPNLRSDLWIDCFDNVASRNAFTGCTGSVLHCGFSPQYTAECIWHEQYSVPGEVDTKAPDICSTVDAVSFIHFVVNAVVLNVSDWITTGRKRNFIITNKHHLQWL